LYIYIYIYIYVILFGHDHVTRFAFPETLFADLGPIKAQFNDKTADMDSIIKFGAGLFLILAGAFSGDLLDSFKRWKSTPNPTGSIFGIWPSVGVWPSVQVGCMAMIAAFPSPSMDAAFGRLHENGAGALGAGSNSCGIHKYWWM